MNRRDFIKIAGLSLAISAYKSRGSKAAHAAADRPDVLIILTDELNPRCLGYAGDPNVKTPNLDRLASEGTIFENCYTPSPVCMPARCSLISGLYPHSHGIWTNNRRWYLPPEISPMFRDIHSAGYATAQIGKIDCYRGKVWGKEFKNRDEYFNALGLDHYNLSQNPYHDVLPGSYQQFKNEEGFGKELKKSKDYWHENGEFCVVPSYIEPHQHIDSFLAQRSVEYIEKQPLDKPYCLVTSFPGPHQPFDAPGKYATMYDPETIKLYPNVPEKVWYKEFWGRDEMRRITANYYGKITLIDDAVGKMVEALKKRGTLDNTIIIFTSDHGDMMGSHGYMGKNRFYDEAVKVPLFIRWPGKIKARQKTKALVQMFDIYPTVVEAIGGSLTDGHFAKSFLPIAEGKVDKTRDAVFSEYGIATLGFMVRTDRYKWFLPSNRSEPESLFDMEKDPYEMKNLVDSPRNKALLATIKDIHLDFFRNTQFNYSANYKGVFARLEEEKNAEKD